MDVRETIENLIILANKSLSSNGVSKLFNSHTESHCMFLALLEKS